MNYLEFHKQWHPYGIFNIRQVYAWCPDFCRHNLIAWVKKGYITMLKKEFYAFTDCKADLDFTRYIANCIYRPSYISLQAALAFYGMIPEAVTQITSVSSLKTASFKNEFGEYTYKSVKPELMFGYEPKPMADGRDTLMATPEKAILDMLYLNPCYNTEADMAELRLDKDFMRKNFKTEVFKEYADRFGGKTLNNRVKSLLAAYGL